MELVNSSPLDFHYSIDLFVAEIVYEIYKKYSSLIENDNNAGIKVLPTSEAQRVGQLICIMELIPQKRGWEYDWLHDVRGSSVWIARNIKSSARDKPLSGDDSRYTIIAIQ